MLEILKDAYSGKKVFLTGHTGFKGAWLLKILNILGAQVTGYSLDPRTENDLYNLINGDEICASVIADIRNSDKVCSAIADFQPDYVFHLAAQPLVRLSYELPAETFEVNAIGTANLLDGIRQLDKICKVILITTDKVYHNNEWIYPYRETDRLGGYDPYSASKACAEIIIDSYRNSFFNKSDYSMHGKAVAVGRAGNVIGGGDWAKDRLMPDIARALSENKLIDIRNPDSIRPWQHVLEPLLGYLLLGVKLAENPIECAQAYNFGPDVQDALSVNEMAKLATSNWGAGSINFVKQHNQPHEAGLLKLDISKAISELNWKPKLNALIAVKMTMDWYKMFYNNRKYISEYTSEQIMEFLIHG